MRTYCPHVAALVVVGQHGIILLTIGGVRNVTQHEGAIVAVGAVNITGWPDDRGRRAGRGNGPGELGAGAFGPNPGLPRLSACRSAEAEQAQQ
jgi:hypothetical protein